MADIKIDCNLPPALDDDYDPDYIEQEEDDRDWRGRERE